MEEAFPYETTADQRKAIEAAKARHGSRAPMDRLVCGDVGYGKTEVAMRAAFKAIANKKQVAVLVPTTLLADQHYHTFGARFGGFPVRIEELSRFKTQCRTAGYACAIWPRARSTSSSERTGCLQKDVAFADLGLIVIDEEQRFGVMHKERLKEYRASVDVLTLSATPIPRTLHMSLVARSRSLAHSNAAQEPHVDQNTGGAGRRRGRFSTRSMPNSTAAARSITYTTGSNRSMR